MKWISVQEEAVRLQYKYGQAFSPEWYYYEQELRKVRVPLYVQNKVMPENDKKFQVLYLSIFLWLLTFKMVRVELYVQNKCKQ